MLLLMLGNVIHGSQKRFFFIRLKSSN